MWMQNYRLLVTSCIHVPTLIKLGSVSEKFPVIPETAQRLSGIQSARYSRLDSGSAAPGHPWPPAAPAYPNAMRLLRSLARNDVQNVQEF